MKPNFRAYIHPEEQQMMRLKPELTAVQPAGTRPSRTSLSLRLAVLPALLLLAGCEAPLNLSGVEQQLQEPVRRTDQIQAVATVQGLEVAVGSNGLVLRRENSDSAWQRQVLEGQPNLIDVESCSDNSLIALAFEQQLWRSEDNARSWQMIELPTRENLLDVACAPDGSYWAVGSFSTVLSSHDQGQSWQENSLGEDAMLSTVQFLSDSTAYITGEFGIVARSDNAGSDWELLDYIPNDFYPQAAHFSTRWRGWVVGLDGMVLHTEDAGASWQVEPTPVAAPLYGIVQAGGELVALGENGTVLSRRQGQWQRLETPVIPVWLRDATLQESGQLLISGGAGTLLSLNIQ